MLHARTDKQGPEINANGAASGSPRRPVREGLETATRVLGGMARGLFTRFTAMKQRAGKPKRLELVETLALGGRRQLFVVQCDNQRYLVGAGAENVGTIVPIESKPAPVEKAAKRPHLVRETHLVRERGRDSCRIVSAEPGRRKSFEAVAETGDLWQ